MADQIRPKDLPAGVPTPDSALIFDNGATVNKVTPTGLIDVAVPLATQEQAEAGTSNDTRMSPLRTAQAVATKAQAQALGVPGSDNNMGTFTGSTIPDNQSAKQGMQALETAGDTIRAQFDNTFLNMANYWSRGPSSATANASALASVLATAVAQGKSIFIPSGEWYCDGGVECLTGMVSIQCDGTVYTNTTVAWLTLKTIGTSRGWFLRGGKFVNLNGTASQKGSSIIKFTSDGSRILTPNIIGVEGYGFYQMFDNSAGTYTTPFGQEGNMNHGLMDGCVPHYQGSLNAKYAIRHRTGSGTGWIYRNCRDDLAVGVDPAYTDPVGTELMGYPAYVRVESGGINAVVSDILFDGHVSGKFAGGISIDGDCAYKSNISMGSMSQIDAQARRTIFFDPQTATQPVLNFSVMPLNVGGDIDIAQDFPKCSGGRFHAQGFGEAYGGRYDASAAGPGAQTLPLVEIQMQASFGCEVELWATGLVQGVAGGGLRKRVYAIRHDGTAVTVTNVSPLSIDNPGGLSANFYDFNATVAGDTVTIRVTYSGTAGGNILNAQYRVTAGAWRVKRLQ